MLRKDFKTINIPATPGAAGRPAYTACTPLTPPRPNNGPGNGSGGGTGHIKCSVVCVWLPGTYVENCIWVCVST